MDERPQRSRAVGLALFFAYCLAYAGFMALAAFGTFSGGRAEGGLASPAFGGVNLAIVYGMALIGGAFALALLYAIVARGGDE